MNLFDHLPSLDSLETYAKVALGTFLPGDLWRGEQLPTYQVSELGTQIKMRNLAQYRFLTGFDESEQLPVTYPALLAFLPGLQMMAAKGFPLPAMGMVHVREEIVQTQPLSSHDVLDIHIQATNMRRHRRGTLVDLVADVRPAGASAQHWRSISTYLSSTTAAAVASEQAEGLPAVPEPAEQAQPEPMAVSGNTGRDFAAVSGDRNPIHLHPLTAKLFGFPNMIAHGRWLMAVSVVAAGVPVGIPQRVVTDFRKPLILPANAELLRIGDDTSGQVWITAEHRRKVHAYTEVSGLD